MTVWALSQQLDVLKRVNAILSTALFFSKYLELIFCLKHITFDPTQFTRQ